MTSYLPFSRALNRVRKITWLLIRLLLCGDNPSKVIYGFRIFFNLKMIRSVYYLTLGLEARLRYEEKLSLINKCDPYCLEDALFSNKTEDYPSITYYDIVNYFICTQSQYTQESFNCYKSLDAYKFVVASMIRKLGVYKFNDNYLLKGKVRLGLCLV